MRCEQKSEDRKHIQFPGNLCVCWWSTRVPVKQFFLVLNMFSGGIRGDCTAPIKRQISEPVFSVFEF